MNPDELCEQIHNSLQALPKYREATTNLPLNGIYFFYEGGEVCSHTGNLRIVRVGIHGERTTLRKRLKQHYGLNREGSVFRRHLGTALLKKKEFPDDEVDEWRRGRKSPRWSDFKDIEDEIDRLLPSNFFFRVVAVEDVGERKSLEEKLIASLSACPQCGPSESWLGRLAWSERIRRSGLWNSNHVASKNRMETGDLKRLSRLVGRT